MEIVSISWDSKKVVWSQMWVPGQVSATTGYVIMDRALEHRAHVSNRIGLNSLSVLHAVKFSESILRKKTSVLCRKLKVSGHCLSWGLEVIYLDKFSTIYA